MLFPGLEPEPLVEELRTRLVEELDYTMEADHQRLFADHYRGHPFIHVPEVVSELSTQRVLTTELAEGVRFEEMETWSQAERDIAAEATLERKRGVWGKSGAVRVDLGGGRIIKKKKK